MRLAVIGCGSIGRRHINNLLGLGHQVVAWNRGHERRQTAAQDFGIEVYDDLDLMLDQSRAEIAVVCSPNSMHLEHATAAVKRGMHIFVEKPVATVLDGMSELIATANRCGLFTHVGSNMRFHFGPSKVKAMLDSGEIGRPLWAYFWGGMHLPDWHPDEDYRQMYSAKKELGGGAVLDFIHEIDLVRWMFGDPQKLAAMTSQSGWLDLETEDVADVLLGYAGGLQVNVHLDYLQRPFQRGMRVVGDKGWVQWDLAKQKVDWFEHQSNTSGEAFYPDGYEHNEMYIEQMRYFLRCIENGTTSDSDLAAGTKALEFALKIKASSVDNQFK